MAQSIVQGPSRTSMCQTPPPASQKPLHVTSGLRKTRSPDEVRNPLRVAVTRPMPLHNGSQAMDYMVPGGLCFDDQGMILPHSILGSLDNFRSYLEAQGERELVKYIPETEKQHLSGVLGRQHSDCGKNNPVVPPKHRDHQSNALQHWYTHMRQRQHQQNLLSSVLHRPVDTLLMNQANYFRETQEQREIMNQLLPAIQSGYGYRVGSEFWSLPQRFGDEVSGITASLTRTQRGEKEPVIHVGRSHSIRQESGSSLAETSLPAPHAWEKSVYLQQQWQEIREAFKDLDFHQPEIDGLEVIGSRRQFTSLNMYCKPLQEEEECGEEQKKEKVNLDSMVQYDDVQLDPLLIPALRFCGQPAHWTGNSTSYQGEVGISIRLNFEALTGEKTCSVLELYNDGSTAIYYTWQQLPTPHSFTELRAPTTFKNFYFNSSAGVILPGDGWQVEIIFKSEVPGIRSELWQLNTHPVLLGGASMQVTLRGVALSRDKTADQRLALERELEKQESVKVCQSMVYEVLQRVRTPERPSSPAERYITEEQEFLTKNPKFQYHYKPVSGLKRLWLEVTPGNSWDLSVGTLRQAVLALPEEETESESTQGALTRNKGLAQLNSLLLGLSPPMLKCIPLLPTTVGRQLWRELLDRLTSEAIWLRHLLGLPETETWTGQTQDSLTTGPCLEDSMKKNDEHEKEGRPALNMEKGGGAAREKDDNKETSKSVAKEKSVKELNSKRWRQRVGKFLEATHEKEMAKEPLLNQASPVIDDHLPLSDYIMDTYRRRLHQKVYVLMERLVDSLCDLVDELTEGEKRVPEP